MPTFSSVARQKKIVPKAVPRRNVQRHANKAPVPVEALTPESQPQSPTLPAQDGLRDTTEASLVQPLAVEEQQGSVLTPPTTNGEANTPTPSQAEEEQNTVPSVSTTRENRLSREVAVEKPQKEQFIANKRSAKAAGLNTQDAGPAAGPVDPASSQLPAKRPSKRRKKAPQGAPAYLLSKESTIPQASPSAESTTRRESSRLSQSDTEDTDALLQRSRAQANAVSNLAHTIETRNTRSRSRQTTVAPDVDDAGNRSSETPLSRRAASRGQAIAQVAEAIVEDAVSRGRKRKKKGPTPEDAEAYEIDPGTTTMNDLTKDRKLGKQSNMGKRLEAEWPEISERWNDRARINRERIKEGGGKAGIDTSAAEAVAQNLDPEMLILDGQIVSTGPRELDFSRAAEAVQENVEAKSDEPIYQYVNSNRVGKYAGLRNAGKSWGEDDEELFYRGLRMFGTDFEMIASLFQGVKSRKDIKNHYVREERYNLAKVMEQRGKGNKEQITLPEYHEAVGHSEFIQLKDFEAELAAEEKRLRDEAEEARIDYRPEEADVAIPSTEVDAEGNEVIHEHAEQPPVEPETAAQAAARRVVESIGHPKQKRQTTQRKARDTSSRAPKGGKKVRKPVEGVEERIGTIDEVGR